MHQYQIALENGQGFRRLADSAFIPAEPTNPDYQEYLDWVAAGNTPEPYVPPVVATPTDWDGFNNAILSDADFNDVFATVNATHPLVAASLPAALAQVASGQTSMFSTVYNQICTLGGATVAHQDTWATLAETYHAPAELVAVVRGEPKSESSVWAEQ